MMQTQAPEAAFVLSEWCSIGYRGPNKPRKPDALRRPHYDVYLLCESSVLKDFASLSGYLPPP